MGMNSIKVKVINKKRRIVSELMPLDLCRPEPRRDSWCLWAFGAQWGRFGRFALTYLTFSTKSFGHKKKGAVLEKQVKCSAKSQAG